MAKKRRTIPTLALVLCAGVGGYVVWHGQSGEATPAVGSEHTSGQQDYTLTFNHRHDLGSAYGVGTTSSNAQGWYGWTGASGAGAGATVQPDPTAAEQPSDGTSSTTSLPQGTQASGNWAGYITEPTGGQRYTSVSGSWTVPNISGSQNGIAAQWIGLGGVSSQDLLQMGTIEQYVNGTVEADVFWEKLPAAAQNIMTVPVGSKINAKISKASGSTWDVTFTATTPSGQTLSKTIPVQLSASYAANIGTSAEWISEDPSTEQNRLYPLANSGTVQFTSALVDGQPISATGNQVEPVALVDSSGDVLIAPSALGSDGASFTTTTLSTGSANSPYSQIGRRRGGMGHGGGWRETVGWTGYGSYSVGNSYVEVTVGGGWR
ncbi:hypothetical protein GCM10025857_11090 [Alicyclobacillus contaminans]|uniref:G1 family glutamic endopeptidase n=1 Tax=Alicyclobacillus contaminans TaxID=392016 RepID=UPI0004049586|nr:G1 family glutamic endopeptidase [Alicyclobacillus contaminans]GMA49752.1 hypothetical protein GCM10025857_11090 [Alicyclobacillus contaminans]